MNLTEVILSTATALFKTMSLVDFQPELLVRSPKTAPNHSVRGLLGESTNSRSSGQSERTLSVCTSELLGEVIFYASK